MVVQIRMFGVLKKFGKDGVVTVNAPQQCLVGELRKLLKEQLSADFPGTFHCSLVDRAAVTDCSRILNNGFSLVNTESLALLSPVCGG